MRKVPFGMYKLTMTRPTTFHPASLVFYTRLSAAPKNYALEDARAIIAEKAAVDDCSGGVPTAERPSAVRRRSLLQALDREETVATTSVAGA
jgi:hypothetical protein